jgi:hypothetical protein
MRSHDEKVTIIFYSESQMRLMFVFVTQVHERLITKDKKLVLPVLREL